MTTLLRPALLGLATAAIAVAAPLGAEVVINEIHFDPGDSTVPSEFIELHNSGAAEVDISGWSLDGGVDYTFPAETRLAAGGFIVVAQDAAQFRADHGFGPGGTWTGRLDNDGEDLRLRDADGQEVDFVDFRVGFPWPVDSAGEGGSLQLVNPALENDLGSSWRAVLVNPTTPGAVNSTFAQNAPPNIRKVDHSPQMPTSEQAAVITVKVTDPDGVAAVNLRYMIVDPGDYVPAKLPASISTLRSLSPNQELVLQGNGAFSDSILSPNWSVLPMADDGEGADAVAGDDIFSASLPAQANRTLVRYRFDVSDTAGNRARWPFADDPRLNFAYYVYDGLKPYTAAGQTYSTEVLESLPVYHLITRNEDYIECMAYSGGDQLSKGTAGARAYNWSGAVVFNGVVYDHVGYRLRGANGRHQGAGKRSMKWRFPKGHHFDARDQDGRRYNRPWRILTTAKMFSNRQVGNFGLVDSINNKLWRMVGVPAPFTHWFHLRVVDGAEEQPDAYGGDFHGIFLGIERYDVRFLEQHGLEKGNLYKLSDAVGGWQRLIRYQAPGAPANGADYNHARGQINSGKTEAWLADNCNLDMWYRWSAVKEAVRHYDWPSPSDKNMAWYFEPDYLPGNNNMGKLWLLPYDHDDTWGPVWNQGRETIKAAVQSKPSITREERNVVREFRDLLWQPDQINPMIDDLAATIEALHPADRERWLNAPSSEGRENWGTLASKVADMKRFAWDGGSWPGGSVGAGGRAAFLDDYAADDTPPTPRITHVGEPGFPVDGIRLRSSTFGNILTGFQGFEAMKFRVAEITDPAAPAHDPAEERRYEWDAVWETDVLTDFTQEVDVPPGALKVGLTYRARVRHKEDNGVWSRWSAPLEFTTTEPAALTALIRDLRITEVMFHPRDKTPEENAAGFSNSDFEWIELQNVGGGTLDLSNVRFTKGIDFDFAAGEILSLEPGAYVLVVRRRAAFEARHGEGHPVAGEYLGFGADDKLGNDGERIKLSYGAGNPIVDFVYNDGVGWPAEADGGGHSLVLVDPAAAAGEVDLNLPGSWKASGPAGGSPGAADEDPGGLTLEDWLSEQFTAAERLDGAVSGDGADPDGDGIANFLEFAFGGHPKQAAASRRLHLPAVARAAVDVGGEDRDFLTLTFRRRTGAPLTYVVEVSDDLLDWMPGEDAGTVQMGAPQDNGDGTETITVRDGQPAGDGRHRFMRLRVSGSGRR